MKIENLKQLI